MAFKMKGSPYGEKRGGEMDMKPRMSANFDKSGMKNADGSNVKPGAPGFFGKLLDPLGLKGKLFGKKGGGRPCPPGAAAPGAAAPGADPAAAAGAAGAAPAPAAAPAAAPEEEVAAPTQMRYKDSPAKDKQPKVEGHNKPRESDFDHAMVQHPAKQPKYNKKEAEKFRRKPTKNNKVDKVVFPKRPPGGMREDIVEPDWVKSKSKASPAKDIRASHAYGGAQFSDKDPGWKKHNKKHNDGTFAGPGHTISGSEDDKKWQAKKAAARDKKANQKEKASPAKHRPVAPHKHPHGEGPKPGPRPPRPKPGPRPPKSIPRPPIFGEDVKLRGKGKGRRTGERI